MICQITDLAARTEGGSTANVVLGVVILVLFTVTFITSGVITYKVRVKKFRDKDDHKDESKE